MKNYLFTLVLFFSTLMLLNACGNDDNGDDDGPQGDYCEYCRAWYYIGPDVLLNYESGTYCDDDLEVLKTWSDTALVEQITGTGYTYESWDSIVFFCYINEK